MTPAKKRLTFLCRALVSAYEGPAILSCIIVVLNRAWTLRGTMLERGWKSLEKEKHLLDWQPLMKKRSSGEKKKRNIKWNNNHTDVIMLPNKTVEIGPFFYNLFSPKNWLNVFHSAGDICMKYLGSFMKRHHLALSWNISWGIFWSVNWLNVPGNKEKAPIY